MKKKKMNVKKKKLDSRRKQDEERRERWIERGIWLFSFIVVMFVMCIVFAFIVRLIMGV